MVLKGRTVLRPGEQFGELFRAAAVYPVLVRWIQRVVCPRMVTFRNMTGAWGGRRLGIRRGAGANVLMVALRSLMSSIHGHAECDTYRKMAILSFGRRKCFPTFVSAHFEVVFEHCGIPPERPLRRLVRDSRLSRTVYFVEGKRSSARAPHGGPKEGNAASSLLYDLGALAFAVMSRETISGNCRARGTEVMKTVYARPEPGFATDETILRPRSRHVGIETVDDVRFVDEENMFVPVPVVEPTAEDIADSMYDAGDWEHSKKRSLPLASRAGGW